MDKDMATLGVGDRLYCVPHDTRFGRKEWLIVSKVGRKWLALSREGSSHVWGRCDRDTLTIDNGGYSTRHELYRSEGEYQQKVELQRVWRELRTYVDRQFQAPSHLNLQAIEQAISLLTPTPKGDKG